MIFTGRLSPGVGVRDLQEMTARAKMMRVRVVLTIEVDPGAWRSTYGYSSQPRKELREDVKKYAQATLSDSGAAEEHAIVRVGVT